MSARTFAPSPSLRENRWRANSTQIIWGVCVAVALTGVALAWWLLEPPCPTSIEIATGSSQGQYYAFAQQYRDVLAEDGIELRIRETAGSVENATLLHDANSDVDIALMQGGAVTHEGRDKPENNISSLAALYYEPLWVFYRGDQGWDDLSQCSGKKLAVGPDGSGTRALACMLLGENGIDSGDSAGTELLPATGNIAADAITAGEIDVAFLVTSPRSPVIRRLLNTPGVQLVDFRRSAAYCRKYRYLRRVTLHEGLLDFEHNLPGGDVHLLAPTASLVVRDDIHPALTPLLLRCVARVHGNGGFLESPGEFPSMHRVDFPLSEAARHHFERGPSPLFRNLPFRWAAWLDRMKMMVLPLATLLIPLVRCAPPVYRWSIRSKIYRWYRVLRDVDQKLRLPVAEIDYAHEIRQLEQVDRELAEVQVPLSYMDEFYDLRGHVAFIREQLCELHTGAVRVPDSKLGKKAA